MKNSTEWSLWWTSSIVSCFDEWSTWQWFFQRRGYDFGSLLIDISLVFSVNSSLLYNFTTSRTKLSSPRYMSNKRGEYHQEKLHQDEIFPPIGAQESNPGAQQNYFDLYGKRLTLSHHAPSISIWSGFKNFWMIDTTSRGAIVDTKTRSVRSGHGDRGRQPVCLYYRCCPLLYRFKCP